LRSSSTAANRRIYRPLVMAVREAPQPKREADADRSRTTCRCSMILINHAITPTPDQTHLQPAGRVDPKPQEPGSGGVASRSGNRPCQRTPPKACLVDAAFFSEATRSLASRQRFFAALLSLASCWPPTGLTGADLTANRRFNRTAYPAGHSASTARRSDSETRHLCAIR
jgi:hypothetical protein